MRDFVKTVRSFLSEKAQVVSKEKQLIDELNRVLPEIGYRVVPVQADGAERRAGRRLGKRLACPRCSRRFALPLHLGRHLAATHGAKKRRAA